MQFLCFVLIGSVILAEGAAYKQQRTLTTQQERSLIQSNQINVGFYVPNQEDVLIMVETVKDVRSRRWRYTLRSAPHRHERKNFRHMCLQNHLQTSPTTPQK